MQKQLLTVVIGLVLVASSFGQVQVNPEWAFRWYWATTETEWGDVIACDGRGNIYVAGRTDTTASYTDWALLRLNTQGETLWVRIFDSPGDGIDEPEGMVIDDSGYVYVAGDVGRSSLAWKMDIAVAKYDSLGNRLWVYQYNGPPSQDDRMENFGIDRDGNLFVVGYSKISTTPDREDYLLIKLLPTGDTAWVRLLPTGNQTFDRLYGVAFDDSNYIYVTGGRHNGTDYDIAVIKYEQDGDTVWTRRYAGPAGSNDVPVGIGVDDSGYVYVGGYTYNPNQDFLAVKFDNQGNLIWAASHNGTGNGTDVPRTAVVDRHGNVYLVGESTRASQRDFLVAKFNNTGALAWAFEYDAGGNMDEIVFNSRHVLKVDTSGRVYFGGATYYVPLSLTLTNTMTFCLRPNGSILWFGRYNGPGNDFDQIKAVALDPQGNCYVSGYSTGIYANWDLFLLKYPSYVGGDEGYIRGGAYYGSVLNPIIGAQVVATGPATDTAYTNMVGQYLLGPLPSGIYNVTFSDTGFADTTISGVVVQAGDTTVVDLFIVLCDYIVGDINSDGNRAGSDVTYAVRYFKGLGAPPPDSCFMDSTGTYLYVAGDVNGNCEFRGSDVTRLVAYFKGMATLSHCHFFPPSGPMIIGDAPRGQPAVRIAK